MATKIYKGSGLTPNDKGGSTSQSKIYITSGFTSDDVSSGYGALLSGQRTRLILVSGG